MGSARDLGTSSDYCSNVLSELHSAVPARAPLALYSRLAGQIAGLHVVVIGDMATDGIACLAHYAASATAKLLDATDEKCHQLRTQASKMALARNRTFHTDCSDFLSPETPLPDADLYVWFQAAWRHSIWRGWLRRGVATDSCRNLFGNCDVGTSAAVAFTHTKLNQVDSFDILATLRAQQLAGRIRDTAEVSMIFDDETLADAWSMHQLSVQGGWIRRKLSFCVSDEEVGTCYTHAYLAHSKMTREICPRHVQTRFHMLGGSLNASSASGLCAEAPMASAATLTTPLSQPTMDGDGWNSSTELALLVKNGRASLVRGLTMLYLPSGAMLCGVAADRALEQHAKSRHGQVLPELYEDNKDELENEPERKAAGEQRVRSGLLMVFSYRQVATEFSASAHVLGLSSADPMIRRSSLMLVCTNPQIQTSRLARWLRWYSWFETPIRDPREDDTGDGGRNGRPRRHVGAERAGRGLRMLLHTRANLGYSCGELHALATTARIWALFPWVLCMSGPDVLPLPGEFLLLGRLLARARQMPGRSAGQLKSQRRSGTALLYDKFRVSPNDPLSYKEPRYNMDLFVFMPPLWAAEESLSANIWASAAAHCIRGSRNRPEAVLHVVQREFNLSVQIIGNNSRGSLIDVHKSKFTVPDALVWHSHNMPAVFTYFQPDQDQQKTSPSECHAAANGGRRDVWGAISNSSRNKRPPSAPSLLPSNESRSLPSS